MRGISRSIAVLVVLACASGTTAPAFAVNEFKVVFAKKYTGEGTADEFKAAVTKAGCNVCHVPGKGKKERNEYGQTLSKSLKASDFGGEVRKYTGGEAEKLILEALTKAEAEKSSTGDTFGDKLKSGKLPAAP